MEAMRHGDSQRVSGIQVAYRRENRRRDELYGKQPRNGIVDTSELADKVKEFLHSDDMVTRAHCIFSFTYTGSRVPLYPMRGQDIFMEYIHHSLDVTNYCSFEQDRVSKQNIRTSIYSLHFLQSHRESSYATYIAIKKSVDVFLPVSNILPSPPKRPPRRRRMMTVVPTVRMPMR